MKENDAENRDQARTSFIRSISHDDEAASCGSTLTDEGSSEDGPARRLGDATGCSEPRRPRARRPQSGYFLYYAGAFKQAHAPEKDGSVAQPDAADGRALAEVELRAGDVGGP